jgi:radical SAM protein with 4Fe4S-binding SPASM domain
MGRTAVKNLKRLSQIYYHYQRRSVSVPYLPIFAGIETTGVCNLRCVMCPHGQQQYRSRKRGHMSFDLFRQVVDEAKAFVYDADLFGGGEPLLNPHIFDMIAYAGAAGIHTRLHTNATLLDEERAQALLQSGLDFLSFSFEGYSKAIYEQIRRNAVYEATLENIQRFLATKKSAGRRKPYTVLQVIEPAPQDRTAEVEAGLKTLRDGFAHSPGLDEFKVIPLHNYGGKIASAGNAQRAQYTPCTFLWYAIYVLWDGTIVPCCVDWWGDYALGNLGEISLKQAWHGEKTRRLRKLIGTGQHQEVELCRQCDRLWRPQRFGVPLRNIRVVRQWLSQHLLGY